MPYDYTNAVRPGPASCVTTQLLCEDIVLYNETRGSELGRELFLPRLQTHSRASTLQWYSVDITVVKGFWRLRCCHAHVCLHTHIHSYIHTCMHAFVAPPTCLLHVLPVCRVYESLVSVRYGVSLLDLALRMGRRSTSPSPTSTLSSLTGAAIEPPHAPRSAALPTAGTGDTERHGAGMGRGREREGREGRCKYYRWCTQLEMATPLFPPREEAL